MAPKTTLDGLQTCPPQSCVTCVRWEHPRGGRMCRRDRKPKGSKVRGTPATYWCDEYTPLTPAKCGECRFWTGERLPRKKAPCSELGLIDGKGNERSAESLHCQHFGQLPALTVTNNPTIRVDGRLSVLLDLDTPSEMQPVLLRSDETSGLLCVWKPAGPGQGSWAVTPVALTVEDGVVRLQGHATGEPRAAQQALFAGTARVTALTHLGPEVHEYKGQNAVDREQRRVGEVVFDVTSRRTRGAAVGENSGGVIETAPAAAVQDEPWGPDWEDLKEQMGTLLAAGENMRDASRAVRKRYEADTGKKLGKDTAKRLQVQLRIEFRIPEVM